MSLVERITAVVTVIGQELRKLRDQVAKIPDTYAKKDSIYQGGKKEKVNGGILLGTGQSFIDSVAIGGGAQVKNSYSSVAIGSSTTVSANSGIAIGFSTIVSADSGTAIGAGAIVSADSGTAIGANAYSTRQSETAIGGSIVSITGVLETLTHGIQYHEGRKPIAIWVGTHDDLPETKDPDTLYLTDNGIWYGNMRIQA